MAEFQWWLLLVGLVAGGGLVAVVSMDGKRREQDLAEVERRAESNWIAERIADTGGWVDGETVDAVLRLHREDLGMPPPDAILVDGEVVDRAVLDGDPDRMPDDIRDDRRGGPDEDLPRAGEEQAPAREEAHAGADGEQRADR